MRKSFQQLQENLKFDRLMEFLDERFQLYPDRRANNTRYLLADVLKSAFAMFSLKSPSLLDFKKQSIPEENNLRSIYRINGEIPCDNQMRSILDPLSAFKLRSNFAAIFKLLCRAGVLRSYKFWH